MNLMVGNTTMNGLKHHLRVEPYDYQREGIVYGLEHRRLIIGDEPGLGKTLQSIGIVDTANAYPCLVICPSSLKINWQREFEKFTDKSAVVLDNAVRTTWNYLLSMGVHQVAVVNYESLRKYFVWDIKAESKQFRLKDVVFCPQIQMFKSIIIDESHRVKDPSAHLYQRFVCLQGMDNTPVRYPRCQPSGGFDSATFYHEQIKRLWRSRKIHS